MPGSVARFGDFRPYECDKSGTVFDWFPNMYRLFLAAAFAVSAAGCSAGAGTIDIDTSVRLAPVTSIAALPTTTSSTSTTSTTLGPRPPALSTQPSHGATVDTYATLIEVASDPGVTLTIEGSDVPVDATGTATYGVLNTPGSNRIGIAARNDAGLSSTASLTYHYEPVAGWAMAIGDSVMLGSKPEIENRIPGVTVDATVSRQFSAVPAMIRSLMARESPPELIIIGLGTNGPARESDFDAVMEAAADVPLVAFVNVRVPRTWEATSNRVIADGVARYPNAVLVDWYSASSTRPELFAGDGVHPRQPGRVILADLIANAVFPLGPPAISADDQ